MEVDMQLGISLDTFSTQETWPIDFAGVERHRPRSRLPLKPSLAVLLPGTSLLLLTPNPFSIFWYT